jgi:K+-transporting ATPase ATPase A chain
MVILAILILFGCNAIFTALACNLNFGPQSPWNHVNNSSPSQFLGGTFNNVNNPGAHGFTEILYSYCSATGNNGSAFAGLTANTPYYNLTLGLAMLAGRFIMIIPLLAMAGSLGRQKIVPASAGTLATATLTFALLLAAIVLVIGAIEYFPALALGPVVDHLQMLAGKVF